MCMQANIHAHTNVRTVIHVYSSFSLNESAFPYTYSYFYFFSKFTLMQIGIHDTLYLLQVVQTCITFPRNIIKGCNIMRHFADHSLVTVRTCEHGWLHFHRDSSVKNSTTGPSSPRRNTVPSKPLTRLSLRFLRSITGHKGFK